jgi:hypothetical protein
MYNNLHRFILDEIQITVLLITKLYYIMKSKTVENNHEKNATDFFAARYISVLK